MSRVNMLFSNYNFHEDWAKKFVSQYLKKTDRLVIIPFSFGDDVKNKDIWNNLYQKNGKYYESIVKPFITLGIYEDHISWINYFTDDHTSARTKIQNSDMIFFTGGYPEKMMERLKEFNLIEQLEQYQGVMIGASAGAMIQISDYHISPDGEYPEFSYQKGLNILKDFGVEVHYKRTEIQDLYINKVLQEQTDTLYALTDEGGMIVNGNEITLIGDVCLFCS